MTANYRRGVSVAMLIGYLVTVATIVSVPVLFIPGNERSEWFWYRIAWTEFLALLIWGYFGGFLSFVTPGGFVRRGYGGIFPAGGVLLVLYVSVSFALVVIVRNVLSGPHLAAQAILLAVLVVVFVGLGDARVGAVAGTAPLPPGLKTPSELSAIIRSHEDKFFDLLQQGQGSGELRQLHDSLKTLRETILYSQQHVGRIGDSEEYRRFTKATVDFCDRLQAAEVESQQLADLRRTSEELRRQVDLVSSSMKVNPT